MQLSGRPLLDTRADAALFVDPTGLVERLQRAVRDRLNVLVSGPRGAGKTSLLRQFLFRLRTSGDDAVMVSAGTANTAADVLELVRRAVTPAQPRPGVVAAVPPAPAGQREIASAVELLEALRVVEQPATVVLLDNVPPGLAHALFGQLRDELWQLPYCWVVTCADRDESVFLRPPADAFFDTVLRLPPLDAEATRELLRRRASGDELDDDTLASVVELSHGNPRRALDLTRQATTAGTSPDRLRADAAQRSETLARLGRPAQMLLAELEASGGASASDEALLSRLGWTRARAAQVLDQLASAELVEATDVRNGPGRPRRVYRPRSAVAR